MRERYYVTKKRVNCGFLNMFSMSRFVVRCGSSIHNMYVGSELECQRFAAELNKAFNDGMFVVEYERLTAELEAKRAYPDQASGLTRVDWNELSKLGLIRRINTEVLHPLGFAVYRDPDSGISGGALKTLNGEAFQYEDKA